VLIKLVKLWKTFNLVFIFFGFVSSVSASDVSKPPIELPFYPQKVGEIYSFDVNVVEQLTYLVGIRFYLIFPNKWSHFFDKDPDPQEAKRFYEILGAPKNIAPGEWIEPGVPAKFRVKIIKKENGNIILEELVNHPKTRAHAYGRTADLVTQGLPEGLYSIRIEYLEGAPEIAPLNAKILFARAHHGK